MSEDQLTDSELESFNKKHKRIRGTHELKYPPKESRCRSECGRQDYRLEIRGREQIRHHPCFLAINHEEDCEFSSECMGHPHKAVRRIETVAA